MVNEEKNKSSEADQEFRNSVNVLVDTMVEGMEEEYHNDLQPYDVHVNQIKKEMQDSMEDFRNSFLEGYELILEELSQQYGIQGNVEGPSPNSIKI
jgi:hypothetical protein